MAFYHSKVAKVATQTNKPVWNESSGIYLAATIASMATSMVFKHLGRKHPVFYLGQWLGPLVIMGLLKKYAQSKHKS